MALLAVTMTAACRQSGDNPYEAELAALLAQTPDDDRAWSALLDGAAEKDQLAAFAAAAGSLADETSAWAPAWIAGEALSGLKSINEAEAAFQRGLEWARKSGVDVGIAQTCNELGWSAYDAGRLDDGATLYEEGIQAAIDAGRNDLQAFLRNNLAGLRVEQGRFAAARDELELASAQLAELGMDGPAAGLQYNRAALEWQLGNLNAARSTLTDVHRSATAAGDSWTLAASSVIRGHIARVLGDTDAAAEHYRQVAHEGADVMATAALGLGQVERVRGNLEAAQAEFLRASEIAVTEEPLIASLARTLYADGQFDLDDAQAGAEGLELAIATADESGDDQTGWVARHLLARRLLEGEPRRARVLLDEAVDRLEARGEHLDAMGDGLYLLRGRSQVYVDAARAALDDPARVWELAGLATGRALRDVGRQAKISTFSEASARLSPGEAVLVLLGGEQEGVGMLVTAGSARAHSMEPLSANRIERFAVEVRGNTATGEALATALFGPFDAALESIDRLWIVVDGALAALPFGALPWHGEYFGTRFAYAVLPTTGVPQSSSGRSIDGDVLLAGAPRFDRDEESGWTPLPFAAREIARLEALWQGRATLLVGDELRAEKFREYDWGRFGLIHFATHAEASSVDPRANGLILSDGERLDLDDVLRANLDHATVILSACRTAEGERVPGQGRLGLVWAFHIAGADEVIASQWAVDDRATAETMATLHGALRSGVDAISAMRQLRRECVEAGCPPARWAAFEVYLRP